MAYHRRSTLASIDANAVPVNAQGGGAPPSAVKNAKSYTSAAAAGGAGAVSSQRASRQSMLPTRSASSQQQDDEHGYTPRQSQGYGGRRDPSMNANQGGAGSQGQRNISGGRQSMAVSSTPASGRRSVSGRASLAPSSVAHARESLLNSSQFARGSGVGESRPVKTRAFQESMWALLTAALGENNMAGGQNIRKAVREPTQLAFVDMFQTIWRRFIDPEQIFESSAGTAPGGSGAGAGGSAGLGTVMSKAVDEIIGLLREIGYPALDDLTKSRLTAAGSTGNWPYCLAMLGWLVQLGEKMNDDAYPIGPRNRQPNPLSSTVDPAMGSEKDNRMEYFYPYLYKTYDKFWNNQDEFPEEREELERIFDERDQQVQRDVEELHKRATTLTKELQELQSNPSPLEEAKQTDELLVSDIRKFQDYYQHHIKRKMEKADSHIKRFASTEAEVQTRLRNLQSERDQLQKEVDAQPMTSDEYDRLESHYHTLQEQLSMHDSKKGQVEAERGNVELEAYRNQNAMEEEFKKFNALAREIGLLPFKVPRESQASRMDGLTMADELTFERGELYPDVDIKNFLGPMIARMKDEESAKRMKLSEEKLKLNQKYDVLLDEVKAARETLAQLNKRHDMTRADIDKINQTSKEESELADSMERDHQRLIHDTEAAGHTAVGEQTAREARLRWQHEQAAASYKQHITAMNDEMVAAMNRLLTLKDDVAQALEKLKVATTVNGSSIASSSE